MAFFNNYYTQNCEIYAIENEKITSINDNLRYLDATNADDDFADLIKFPIKAVRLG